MKRHPILSVNFFRTDMGKEPVREFLQNLSSENRKLIGEDIKTVQFGWPLGMPLIRKLETDLWEVRSNINNGITRVIFTVVADRMVLLHAFIKKSQKTPTNELKTARMRLKLLKDEL